MKIRILLSTTLVSVLTVFLAFAVAWTLTAYIDVTYGMPGKLTTFVVGIGGEQSVTVDRQNNGAGEIQKYIEKNNLAVIVSSTGDGPPRMLLGNTKDILPWINTLTLNPSDVVLFENTYSDMLWKSDKKIPFLPHGILPKGVVKPPREVDDLQYLQMLSNDITLPPGRYIINTQDPEILAQMVLVLADSGLRIHSFRDISIGQLFRGSPLIAVTVVLFLLGVISNILHWVLLSLSRTPENMVRRHHGEQKFYFLIRELTARVPWIFLGTIVGSLFAALLVIFVGGIPLSVMQWVALFVASGATMIVCIVSSIFASLIVSGIYRRNKYV